METVSYGGALDQSKLTESERREALNLEKQHLRDWRKFWARVYKRQGLSNVDIGNRFGLSESTVRAILKGSR